MVRVQPTQLPTVDSGPVDVRGQALSLATELSDANTGCSGRCWDCTLACASEDTDDLEEARDGGTQELSGLR